MVLPIWFLKWTANFNPWYHVIMPDFWLGTPAAFFQCG